MHFLDHYVIDWDKVKTVDDLKNILAHLRFGFEVDNPNIENIRQYLKRQNKSEPHPMPTPPKPPKPLGPPAQTWGQAAALAWLSSDSEHREEEKEEPPQPPAAPPEPLYTPEDPAQEQCEHREEAKQEQSQEEGVGVETKLSFMPRESLVHSFHFFKDTRKVATIGPDGIMRFVVEANDENAQEFIKIINNLLGYVPGGKTQPPADASDPWRLRGVEADTKPAETDSQENS